MVDDRSDLDKLFGESTNEPETQSPVRRKRKSLRNTLIVLGSLLGLLGIGAGIAYALVNSSFNEIQRVEAFDPSLDRPEAVEVPEGTNAPLNILLLGSDSRETVDPDATANDLTGFRSDVIMVAQISPDRKNVTFMSIMRDNWVPIQGNGEAKINAAVAFGGVPLAVNTVENFIGARIDHVALIDFDSFKGLTDAVGGVTVNNTIPFTSHHGNFDFAEGEITLNGEQALGFVRERYAFPDGDYQRARNQQIYLKGLMKEILSRDTLTSPSKVTGTFDALKPYLVLDDTLDLNTAVSLGVEMRNVRNDSFEFFTSPTLGTGVSPDGQSIVLPDWAQMEKVRVAFQEGTLNDYVANMNDAAAVAP